MNREHAPPPRDYPPERIGTTTLIHLPEKVFHEDSALYERYHTDSSLTNRQQERLNNLLDPWVAGSNCDEATLGVLCFIYYYVSNRVTNGDNFCSVLKDVEEFLKEHCTPDRSASVLQ